MREMLLRLPDEMKRFADLSLGGPKHIQGIHVNTDEKRYETVNGIHAYFIPFGEAGNVPVPSGIDTVASFLIPHEDIVSFIRGHKSRAADTYWVKITQETEHNMKPVDIYTLIVRNNETEVATVAFATSKTYAEEERLPYPTLNHIISGDERDGSVLHTVCLGTDALESLAQMLRVTGQDMVRLEFRDEDRGIRADFGTSWNIHKKEKAGGGVMPADAFGVAMPMSWREGDNRAKDRRTERRKEGQEVAAHAE